MKSRESSRWDKTTGWSLRACPSKWAGWNKWIIRRIKLDSGYVLPGGSTGLNLRHLPALLQTKKPCAYSLVANTLSVFTSRTQRARFSLPTQ
jgi:hypothetical protein